MDKKKWDNFKRYVDDISPLNIGTLFWLAITYLFTYFVKSPFEANWFVLFGSLFIFNASAIMYGRQCFLLDRKNKDKAEKMRHMIRFVLTLIICIAINCYYAYRTKRVVIGIYFLITLVFMGGTYWYGKLKKR